jgi:integrase
VIETDQCLTFRIQGAKVSEITGGGQAWRELTVDAWRVLDDDLMHVLLTYIQTHQITTIQIDPKNAFQKRLLRIRNKMAQYNPVWSKVSAYSFRHQFAADLKTDTTVQFDVGIPAHRDQPFRSIVTDFGVFPESAVTITEWRRASWKWCYA